MQIEHSPVYFCRATVKDNGLRMIRNKPQRVANAKGLGDSFRGRNSNPLSTSRGDSAKLAWVIHDTDTVRVALRRSPADSRLCYK